MMMETCFTEKIFTYHDAMPGTTKKLPEALTFNNPPHEAILCRLLLGTIDIEHNFESSKIKQRINFANLGIVKNQRLGLKVFEEIGLPVLENKDIIDNYFRGNRRNNSIYRGVLIEFSNYFYQKNKGAYLSSFVHLYRCIEFISYSFPLIYASKSRDYNGTYNALKLYFSDDQKSELKFFKKFQLELIDNNVLNLRFDIEIESPNSDMSEEFIKIIRSLCSGLDLAENNELSLPYKDLFDFTIRLRNRYFHLLSGTNQRNIQSDKIIVENLFKGINDIVANWIAYIYFEILKFGLENN